MFDYFYHNRTVRLLRLLYDLVLCVVLVQSFFVLRNFLLDKRYGIVMSDIFLEHKMESLADTTSAQLELRINATRCSLIIKFFLGNFKRKFRKSVRAALRSKKGDAAEYQTES